MLNSVKKAQPKPTFTLEHSYAADSATKEHKDPCL